MSGPAARLLVALLAALLASATARAHPPYGLVADARGNVYFSDLEAVWRLTPEGRLELFRPARDGFHVHEITLAPDGAIEGEVNHYDPASETFSGGLWRRSADGHEQWVLAPTPMPPRGFGTYRDARGRRYVAQWVSNDDRRTMLFRRSSDGVELLFGPGEAAASYRQALVSSVGAMAATADGGMIFADGPALRRISPSGEVTTVHEAREGTGFRGVSIALDGRVVAADAGGKAVVAVAPGGDAERLYREADDWLPTAALFVGGRLLVLEANADVRAQADRVRVIEVASGRSRVIAQPGAAAAPTPRSSAPPADAGERRRGLAVAAAVGVTALIALLVARRARK